MVVCHLIDRIDLALLTEAHRNVKSQNHHMGLVQSELQNSHQEGSKLALETAGKHREKKALPAKKPEVDRSMRARDQEVARMVAIEGPVGRKTELEVLEVVGRVQKDAHTVQKEPGYAEE